VRYSLLWSEDMAIFVLTSLHDNQPHTYTEAELLQQFAGTETLNQWAAFAKANAGKECVYDFLPS